MSKPKIKDIELVRGQLRAEEQSGREPEKIAYPDHKGILTIATGFNLTRPDARKICHDLEINFDDITHGVALTNTQAQNLEDYVIFEITQICINKLGLEHFDKLSSEQQAAIISVAMTPEVLGPRLIGYIRNGQYEFAADEIQSFSNRDKNPGTQNRRNREAALFRSGTHLAARVPNPTRLVVIQTPAPLTAGDQEISDKIQQLGHFVEEFFNCERAIEKGIKPDITNFERLYQLYRTEIIMADGNETLNFDFSHANSFASIFVRCSADYFASFYGKKNELTLRDRLDAFEVYKLKLLEKLHRVPAEPQAPVATEQMRSPNTSRLLLNLSKRKNFLMNEFYAIQQGANLSVKDTSFTSDGWNALHWAVYNGRVALIVEILADRRILGSSINDRTSSTKHGFWGHGGAHTVLHILNMAKYDIAKKNRIAILLLRSGADATLKDLDKNLGYVPPGYIPERIGTSAEGSASSAPSVMFTHVRYH